VLTVEFTVLHSLSGLNGGPTFKHSEAFSFQIATDNREETDRYWNAIVGNGGKESQCGWCKDRWGPPGRSPRALTDACGQWRSGQACLRGDDADAEDQRRGHRGRASRLTWTLRKNWLGVGVETPSPSTVTSHHVSTPVLQFRSPQVR
jgi:hypothetical protein